MHRTRLARQAIADGIEATNSLLTAYTFHLAPSKPRLEAGVLLRATDSVLRCLDRSDNAVASTIVVRHSLPSVVWILSFRPSHARH